MNTSRLYLFLLLITYGFSCPDCDEQVYESTEVIIDVNKMDGVYSLFDTLSVSSTIEELILENGHEVSTKNAYYVFPFNIYKYDGTFFNIIEKDSMQFTSVEGHYFEAINLHNDRMLNYDCSDENCYFRAYTLLNQSGLYILKFNNFNTYVQDDCHHLTIDFMLNQPNNHSLYSDGIKDLTLVDKGRKFYNRSYTNDQTLYFFRVN